MSRTRVMFYGFALAMFNFLWGIQHYKPEKLDSAFSLMVLSSIWALAFYASDKWKEITEKDEKS